MYLDMEGTIMTQSLVRPRTDCRFIVTAFVAFLAVLSAQPSVLGQGSAVSSVAGSTRPSNVPKEYVATPFGFFHPSCTRSLAKGERILSDKRVQHADGTVEENALACSYPHYTPSGVAINAGSTNTSTGAESSIEVNTSPEVSGWLENANVATGSQTQSYGALLATWTVPPQPSANDGQVLYFFPGLEDIYVTESILQPVLGWYQGQWSLASWNCCINGVVANSPAVNVTAGDEIYGSITSTCPAGSLSCPTWNVLSLDLSTGESTTLSDTPSEGQEFNWAFGGVLEPYYVVRCEDYPSNRHLKFDKVIVFDQELHPVDHPQWNEGFNSQVLPQCHYGVQATPHDVSLDY
jgi:hypothetical protein